MARHKNIKTKICTQNFVCNKMGGMENNNFLLEILVQELPYQFIPSAQAQLESGFKKLLEDNKLKYSKIKTYATPRRLAVVIEGLDYSQDDIIKDVKGPILSIALDESGNYTKAAEGFAKKNGVLPDNLYQKDGYIFAKIEQKGKTSKEVLTENIKPVIMKLQGSHFMRWGYFEEKFSRPIEGIVALFNEDVLNVEIFNKKASNKTKGHRFAEIKEIEIKNPLEYVDVLKKVNVYADVEERKQLIIDSAIKKAEEVSCKIDFSKLDDLLDEVTYITEFPIPVVCEFKKEYLQIPDIVTVTVMSKHQRYFPLYENSGKLSNKFITMANFVGNSSEALENIQKGNQRVISARLEDGKFFYEDDIKTSLEEKLPSLSGMTFQRGLGTLLDKTERISELSSYICDLLKIADKTDILRTAKLCKADLSTKLVFEFTELQGFIGENYALKSGEKENVALGIKEHYFPLNAYSELPSSLEGQIVSIADKIDTITAVFLSTQGDKKKKRPTGSNDPLGVRRAILGVLKTVINFNLKLNLDDVIKKSIEMISKSFDIKVENETFSEIVDFIYGRLNVIYEQTYSNDVLAACKNSDPLYDLNDWLKRVEAVEKFVNASDLSAVLEAINRVLKITASHKTFDEVDETLFVQEEEKVLYSAIKNSGEINYANISEIARFIEPLNKFFDKVLVMDKDEKIKTNRLNLLSKLSNKFNSICDFSKIVSR